MVFDFRLIASSMNDWFYARGEQQSGPVTLEKLRELAASGGLDPEKDLVWNSSMTDWLPAGKVDGIFSAPAEVAAVVPAADPSNPYAAPQSSMTETAPTSAVGLAEIIPGSEPIDVMACVKRGFELTKRHFGIILLIGLVYIGISIGASLILGAIDSALGLVSQGASKEVTQFGDATVNSYAEPNGPIESIVGGVLSILLSLGVSRIGLNLVSGQQVSVGMLFGQADKLLRGIVASLLFGLMVGIGLILLIVPGVYLILRYGQYMNAIVDRNMGIMESLSYSSSITTNNRMNLFVLMLMTIAIVIAGCLALVVGLIFAYPVIWLSWAVAYRWMQYGHRTAMDQPGTTTPMLAGV